MGLSKNRYVGDLCFHENHSVWAPESAKNIRIVEWMLNNSNHSPKFLIKISINDETSVENDLIIEIHLSSLFWIYKNKTEKLFLIKIVDKYNNVLNERPNYWHIHIVVIFNK